LWWKPRIYWPIFFLKRIVRARKAFVGSYIWCSYPYLKCGFIFKGYIIVWLLVICWSEHER
jgi:hypothetical protein